MRSFLRRSDSPPLLLLLSALAAGPLTGIGCGGTRDDCRTSPPTETGTRVACVPAEFPEQPYDVVLPAGEGPHPLVFLNHGGSGNRNIVHRVTCPAGDSDDPRCFAFAAADRGYVVVIPTGTPAPLVNYVWAAGGGVGEFRCTGEGTCDGTDHVPYFDALIDEVSAFTDIDPARIFSTGISNGGAMSYRLACDRPEVFAAIASVAGMNAAEVAPGCSPEAHVGILHIHGTADPCAPYEGGPPSCPAGQAGLRHISVEDSLLGDEEEGFVGWTEKNGCAQTSADEPLPNTADDGTSATRQRFDDCPAGGQVVHIRVDDGGHTWPGGFQELDEDVLGVLAQDFLANDEILDFFDTF